MLLDAAPDGANGGWVNGGYKDFAPTELRQGLCRALDHNVCLDLRRRNRIALFAIVRLGLLVALPRESRLTRDLDGGSGVRNDASGNRERNAAPLRS
jgi:hypothetical protein